MPIEDSDQPVRPRSLIRVYYGRSMGSQGFNVSSGGKLRLWSDCADVQTDLNLRCTHMPAYTLRWIPAQFIINNNNARLTMEGFQ